MLRIVPSIFEKDNLERVLEIDKGDVGARKLVWWPAIAFHRSD